MNGTTPHIQSRALLKRFRNWEAGFDLYNAGHPIEHCRTGHAKVTASQTEGWNAAKKVDELASDTQAMLVFALAKKRFNGIILL